MNYDSLVVYQCVQFATDRHFCGFSVILMAAAESGFEAEMLGRNESMGAGMSVTGDRHRQLTGRLCGALPRCSFHSVADVSATENDNPTCGFCYLCAINFI